MICKKCLADNDESFNFCNQCGQRLEAPKPEPTFRENSSFQPQDSKLALGNVQYGKVFLAFGIVLTLILGSAISTLNSAGKSPLGEAPSSEPNFLPSDALTEIEISELSKSFCEPVNEALTGRANIKQKLEIVKQNSASVKAASKDAWASATWKKENPTWFEGDSYSEQVTAYIKSAIASNAGKFVEPLLDGAEFEKYMSHRTGWTNLLLNPVIDSCGLDETLKTLAEYDEKILTISNQAQNIPWYPKGFSEIPQYPGFALGKTNGSCSYSFGSCAIFNIVSQTACPTSLYVEANGLNGDIVTSWGNDTARIAAGQIARIEITFSENVDKWQLTKINCY